MAATTGYVSAPPSTAEAEQASRTSGLVRRLPADGWWGWVGPLLVTGFAAFLRFDRLAIPHAVVFDETYYAHDSYSLLRHGVELNNDGSGAGFVVHPPLGKWMIALGEWLFSNGSVVVKGTVFPADGHGHLGSFGFRFSAALFGTLAVLVLARAARRMFGSTLLGCIAGLLLALDGLAFVQSRIAMLDGFLMFWLVAAFACLVADRDDGLRRVAARLGTGGRFGPWLGLRWWRLAAGICLGGAVSTKWSGIYYLPVFALLAWAWDTGARRAAGVASPRWGALLLDGLPSLVPYVLVPAIVYTASWTGWFLGDAGNAWGHDKYVHAGQSTLAHGWAVLRGWWSYHQQIWHFHVTLNAGHPYKSGPLGWLVLARPVAYFYSSPKDGEIGCTVAQCSREVLGVGTPAIWWASVVALAWTAWVWVSRRDWRAAAILWCFAAGYVPWFFAGDRTMFLFYALPSLPFMVLAVTLCIGLVLGRRSADERRRRWGAIAVGAYLAVVTWNFFWLYPILAAKVIPYSHWHDRMVFRQCTSAGADHEHETAPCWI